MIETYKTDLRQYNNKFLFVGISLSSTSASESGIAVLDRNLNLLRIDKIFNLNELQLYIKNLAPADSMIICVDLPKNGILATGKWRIEARGTKTFRLNREKEVKRDWTERFSDRGTDLCDNFNTMGIDTFRYYCYFSKNILKLNPPFKSRSPAACKYLQMIIQNNLNISGIPTNLIPLSGLDALVGAYTGWKIATTNQNTGYKCIGKHKNIQIVTAL